MGCCLNIIIIIIIIVIVIVIVIVIEWARRVNEIGVEGALHCRLRPSSGMLLQ